MRTKKDYQALKPYLYTDVLLEGLDEQIRLFQAAHEDYAYWITLDGFFWFPRTLFGIENHLLAFL